MFSVVIAVFNRDAEVITQGMYGLIEGTAVAFHDKIDNVAMSATGETIEPVGVREKRETLGIVTAMEHTGATICA